jgi:GNAT superfamily N-acetyltransferase
MKHQSNSASTAEHTSNAISLADEKMKDPFSALIEREISFRRITSNDDKAEESFIDVYKKAFAGPPYFEKSDSTFVREKVWKAHQGQMLIVAEEKGTVIGLICGHLLTKKEISPSACNFIQEHLGGIINERGTLYFSELAVAPSHQGIGVASVLVASALTWASENHISKFILRTASRGSNSIGIFKKFGAREFKLTQNVESAEAGGPSSASTQRIYLAGDVSWHGDYLSRVADQVSESIMTPPSKWCHD